MAREEGAKPYRTISYQRAKEIPTGSSIYEAKGY